MTRSEAKADTVVPSAHSGRAGRAGRTLRAVVVLSAAEVLGKLATLAVVVMAARSLSTGDFGAFSYALAFGLLLATITSWGLDSLLVRDVGRHLDRLPNVYAQVLVLRAFAAVPVIVVGGVLGMLTRPGPAARVALVLVLVACVLDTVTDAARAAAGALERQEAAAAVLVAQRVVTALGAAALLASGRGLVGLSVAYLAGTAVGTVLMIAQVARSGARPAFRGVTRHQLASTTRRSIPLGLDVLAAMVIFRADAVLIGLMEGDAAVASYAAAYRLIETVLFVNWAVSRAVFPRMTKIEHDSDVCRATERVVALTCFVFIPYTVLLLARGADILDLVFGPQYAENSSGALTVLAPSTVFFAIGFALSYTLVARSQFGPALGATVAAAVVNVGANLVLIPLLSIEGAAAATTLAYAFEAIVLAALVTSRVGRIRIGRAVGVPLAAAVPTAAVAYLPLPVLVSCTLAALVYAVSWLLLARRHEPDQVALLATLARKGS